MNIKYIDVQFKEGLRDAYVGNVTQWDYGQVLKIQGIELPAVTTVYFSMQQTGGKSIPKLAITSTDGCTYVSVPKQILEQPVSQNYKAYAFVYPSTPEEGRTVGRITMSIKSIPKPEDLNSPEDESLFQQVLEQLNLTLQESKDLAKLAESYAKGGTGTRENEDVDNSKFYAQLAQDYVQNIGIDRDAVEQIKLEVQQLKQAIDFSEQNIRKDAEQVAKDKQDITLAVEDVRQNKQSVDLAQADVTSKSEQVTKDAQQTVKDVQQTAKDKKAVEDVKTQFVQDVKTATDSITQQTNTSLSSIDTKTAEQLKAVENKGTEQVKAVEQVGAQFTQELPKLKQDISSKLDRNLGIENKDKVLKVDANGNVVPVPKTEIVPDNLQEDILKNAVKPIVKGNPIVLKDSASYKPVKLEISGSTTQGENPSPQSPQPIVNGECDRISFNGKNLFDISNAPLEQKYFSVTKENNGIRIKGKTPSSSTVYPAIIGRIPLREKTVGKTYTFSIKTIMNQFILLLFLRKTGGKQQSLEIKKGQKSATVKINDNYETIDMIISGFPLDTEIDVLIDDIQLELGSQATEYEPYKGQTVTFPKIELSKWDKIKKIDGIWKKEVNSYTDILDESFILDLNYYPEIVFKNFPKGISKESKIYCNYSNNVRFSDNSFTNIKANAVEFGWENDRQNIKDYLSNLKINGNGMKIMYETAEPTYEELPFETQDALNQIQTFYPNSVIQTNEGLEMDIKYIADTKLYIDNKFAELQKNYKEELAKTQKYLL